MPVNEMQVPEGLMNFLIVVAAMYAIQTMVGFGYFVLEIIRNGRDHLEADRTEVLPDDTEWEASR